MHKEEGLTVEDVADIYTLADCWDWSASTVYDDLKEAADDFGVSMTAWNYWAENDTYGNGIDH